MAQKCRLSQVIGDELVFSGAESFRLRENGPFLEFSLCLSRACLGKMFVFICKWLKKTEKQNGSLVVAVVPSLSG
jgi:hypothetical protein